MNCVGTVLFLVSCSIKAYLINNCLSGIYYGIAQNSCKCHTDAKLKPSPLSLVAIVGHCDLSSTDADDILKRHALSRKMRGIRHMLNFHPDYPQFSEVKHDNYLSDKGWIEGFGLLEKYQMSFEFHILPVQMNRSVINNLLCQYFFSCSLPIKIHHSRRHTSFQHACNGLKLQLN